MEPLTTVAKTLPTSTFLKIRAKSLSVHKEIRSTTLLELR